ncbi:flavodoxin [Blastococcus sp. CT_GayMR16]|uniref:flavodoxin n=1 Tax=Blastococcus sp. CT_GayMR16 TaxID=2559607 RepID=UPI001073A4CB|nr:flavodoxin [Blastococcus sp. CT_GayMR16]TFV87387.1 flavodoxin [Blastococcus sp. CT_GayMR16]
MGEALVVYESVFGDSETIARAVAAGLSAHLATDVASAADAPTGVGPDVRLLVVGGPTHAFGMPKPATREGAVKQYGAQVENTGSGLHEWLDAARVPAGTGAAAFDTRMDHPKLVTKLNHAAKSEEKLLKGLGLTLVSPAEHFFVVDPKGPLADGEEERARQWGRALAEIVTAGTRR